MKQDKGNDCLMSVDGTDFRVKVKGKEWYSYKFKKGAVRYEVALCILTGDIVWINGPYEPGIWNDIEIFRNSLMSHLGPMERVEADDGYIGEAPRHVKCPRSIAEHADDDTAKEIKQRLRNRQETVNMRFKMWGALAQPFRNEVTKHGGAFRAIAVIVQLSINQGERLFDVDYDD